MPQRHLFLTLAIFTYGALFLHSAPATNNPPSPPPPPPRTLYVDANATTTNTPAPDGLSPLTAFKTIQQAADQVHPGDTVIVGPGVYFETVQLRTTGTPDAPITFKADQVALNRVTITGANQAIRQRQAIWQCVDEPLQLYSIRTDTLRQPPSRILYGGTDLFPYPTLEALKKFELTYPATYPYPGPSHGFTWDTETRTLYVRLHATGRYGSTNPNDHLMAIAPINGAGGGPSMTITRPEHYNFGILSTKPAHVILDGFTFETPGVAGVYIGGPGHVTIRNNWFTGCRTGVSGRRFYNRDADYAQTTNNVTIEYTEYHCFPAFNDMREVIDRPLPPPPPPLQTSNNESTGGIAKKPSATPAPTKPASPTPSAATGSSATTTSTTPSTASPCGQPPPATTSTFTTTGLTTSSTMPSKPKTTPPTSTSTKTSSSTFSNPSPGNP